MPRISCRSCGRSSARATTSARRSPTGHEEKPENLIASFRNSPNPRIAVTVDMISTGTDIKPLECLIFMRDVKSQVYFEQMKGRGTRTISPTDLESVTPGARHKTHFVIVDAVGVCERDKTRHPAAGAKEERLLREADQVCGPGRSEREDTSTTLAGRLARLDRELEEKDREELKEAAGGRPMKQIINGLLDAVDPDKQEAKAKEIFQTESPPKSRSRRQPRSWPSRRACPSTIPNSGIR